MKDRLKLPNSLLFASAQDAMHSSAILPTDIRRNSKTKMSDYLEKQARLIENSPTRASTYSMLNSRAKNIRHSPPTSFDKIKSKLGIPKNKNDPGRAKTRLEIMEGKIKIAQHQREFSSLLDACKDQSKKSGAKKLFQPIDRELLRVHEE